MPLHPNTKQEDAGVHVEGVYGAGLAKNVEDLLEEVRMSGMLCAMDVRVSAWLSATACTCRCEFECGAMNIAGAKAGERADRGGQQSPSTAERLISPRIE
jgi:hypothetical protein